MSPTMSENETNQNLKFSNVQNKVESKDNFEVLVLWILEIWICLGARYSDFGFAALRGFCGSTLSAVGDYYQSSLEVRSQT